jgi:RHS repeat-associated protein
MQREDGAVAYLYYDQVGSLRVVADESGNVIKEVLYDPFGGIIEDSSPEFRIPIGFAGGLHDRDLGFVRFGWRDYDTFTSRWTAPDPMGDAGGDPDWYGYCLDDPVNGIDPLGLFQVLGEGPGGRIVGSMIEGAAGGAVAGGMAGGPAGAAAGAAVDGALGGLRGVYEEGELPEDREKKDPNEPRW